mmetsp:Transcript_17870/g.32353  ORF Transcript_17870/g.32353 Transcript_17870/m.32353 type:complete len:324 (-) Transcript_17870:214-1185(-)
MLLHSALGFRHRTHSCLVLGSLATAFLTGKSSAASFYSNSRMTTHSTTQTGDGLITVAPKNEGDQSALVVICHGLGDTAEGFADVAEQMATQLPHVKFILPTAPTQPVTMNMGMPMPSWYDIVGLDERSNEQCDGLDESESVVKKILQNEHDTLGLPYSRMVLAGFSQGAALSLYTGLQLEHKLAGILALSGYVPRAQQLKITDGLQDTPILHCHGEADPMVNHGMAVRSKEHITSIGATSYTLKSYPGLSHSVSPEELADAMEFLEEILPADDSFKIKLKDPTEMSVKELKAAVRKAGISHKALGFMEKSEFIRLLQDHRSA